MEFQKLQRIIADVLNISEDKITKESAFVDDLKADSLDVFQIITEIEDQFGIQIPEYCYCRRCSNSDSECTC